MGCNCEHCNHEHNHAHNHEHSHARHHDHGDEAQSRRIMLARIIVSALLAPADQRRLDDLRRAHYPPDRNRLPAHLTLFHHLPPSVETELVGRLRAATRAAAPDLRALSGRARAPRTAPPPAA